VAPIRVLYLDHTAALSGGELALARLLGALDRARVEPIVVLAEDGPLRALLCAQSIETHVLPMASRLRETRKDSLGLVGLARHLRSLGQIWAYARSLSRLARERGAQIIYANSLKSDFYGALAARMARVPVIWHVRDRIEESYLPPAAVRLVRLTARHVPACVIANSAGTLATLRLARGQCSAVIASGLSRDHIERCWVAERRNTVPRIGIIGRLARWKGQDIFLRAAALLRQQGWPAEYCIAGGALFGEETFEAELRSLACELGIGDQVEFAGHVDVPAELRRLDILVHASTLPEPFGQVIVEGMAAEIPIVATDAGGAREIIEDGRTGLLVRMGDPAALAAALDRLLADPGYARGLATAARRHALENYTIEQSARRSETLYERVLRAAT